MRTIKDILKSNELNTYTMSCYPNKDELYKQMREDISILCGQLEKLDIPNLVEAAVEWHKAKSVHKPVFEINVNWHPLVGYLPCWKKMSIDEYAKEYGIDVDGINEMIKNGAIRLVVL